MFLKSGRSYFSMFLVFLQRPHCDLYRNNAEWTLVTVSGKELIMWRDQEFEKGHYSQSLVHDDFILAQSMTVSQLLPLPTFIYEA